MLLSLCKELTTNQKLELDARIKTWSDITGLKTKKDTDKQSNRKTHQEYKSQTKALLDPNPLWPEIRKLNRSINKTSVALNLQLEDN